MSRTLDALRAALANRYSIGEELGSGGAATVYLAHDLKHDRQVAMKVLRSDLSSSLGPERFVQEIAIAAKLQHPHILTVLDSGEADGSLFYVMPFVEGQSLRQRLALGGELPISDAVRIFLEVADAIAFAHGRGVVHRDIKPENIMLSGRHAVVADFGVAKALSEATGRHQLTTIGVALGTPAYMAPEQAAAEPTLDHRVDIYALGVVAYEMLAGVTPFSAPTPQALMAAHLTQTPTPLRQRRGTVSETLSQIVMRSLEKSPADRWQSADEIVRQLEAVATPTSGVTPVGSVPLVRSHAASRWGAAAAVITVAAGAAWVALGRPAAPPPSVVVGQLEPLTFTGRASRPSLSPDGRMMAYIEGDTALVVQDLPDGRPLTVATDENFYSRRPRWSPDGTVIAYATAAGLFITPRLGGRVQRVARGTSPMDFRPDGRLTAWSPEGGAFLVLDAQSLVPTDSLVWPEGEWRPYEIRWSPDGQWLAATGVSSVIVVSSNGEVIERWGDWPRSHLGWAPNGDALYYVISGPNFEDDLGRFPVDRGTGRRSGDWVPILRGINTAFSGEFDLSAGGDDIVFTRGLVEHELLFFADALGDDEPSRFDLGSRYLSSPAISPDGQRLAFVQGDRAGDNVYTMLLSSGEAEAVSSLSELVGEPLWSPDGSRVAFTSATRDLVQRVWTAEPGSAALLVTSIEGSEYAYVGWVGSERLLVQTADSLLTFRLDGTLERATPGPDAVLLGELSPSGRRTVGWTDGGDLVIVSTETGLVEQEHELDFDWIPLSWMTEDRLLLQDPDGIYELDLPTGSPRRVRVFPEACGVQPIGATRDSRALVCIRHEQTTDLWRARLAGR